MSASEIWTGHCLCGAVRYEATGAPLNKSLCHCEDCRRASGSTYQGWVFFAKPNFQLLSGKLHSHAYEGRERSFCAQCGSPITFTDKDYPDIIEVTLGTMDKAAKLKPDDHNWTEDRLPWVPVDHSLPQFIHNAPAPCST